MPLTFRIIILALIWCQGNPSQCVGTNVDTTSQSNFILYLHAVCLWNGSRGVAKLVYVTSDEWSLDHVTERHVINSRHGRYGIHLYWEESLAWTESKIQANFLAVAGRFSKSSRGRSFYFVLYHDIVFIYHQSNSR